MITAYVSMARAIESMGLEGVWNLKPMFNGGEVKEILPNLPRGPVFSDVMNVRSGNQEEELVALACIAGGV